MVKVLVQNASAANRFATVKGTCNNRKLGQYNELYLCAALLYKAQHQNSFECLRRTAAHPICMRYWLKQYIISFVTRFTKPPP